VTAHVKYVLVAASLFVWALPSWAHGINLFATVEGTSIQGTLLYADGTPAANAPVIAYAPDGDVIAEVITDDTGRFVFEARVRVRHRLVGDAGQGHRGLFTIAAEDLPTSLPEPGAPNIEPVAEVAPIAVPPVDAGALPADFDARLEAAVARQLRPLREQIDRYEHSIRIRDVMGGIGYLFGLVGIVVLLKHRYARRTN
jgi:nickel transport protein